MRLRKSHPKEKRKTQVGDMKSGLWDSTGYRMTAPVRLGIKK